MSSLDDRLLKAIFGDGTIQEHDLRNACLQARNNDLEVIVKKDFGTHQTVGAGQLVDGKIHHLTQFNGLCPVRSWDTFTVEVIGKVDDVEQMLLERQG